MPSARADEINVTITATPTELADTGTVTFTFEIANYNADYPLLGLTITYNGTIYDVTQGQEVPPSGTLKNIVLPLTVNASQLGNPITFTLSWTRNGEPMTQDATYTVQRAENPVIEVTRTADKQNAKPGETVTLTYVIKNSTKFDMTDITLIDENISDNAILQLNTLRASGTYSIDYSYIMGEESVVSTPFATYTVNGKTKTFTSAESMTLTMVLIQLDMNVSMGTPTTSGVTFTFDITNTGSQTISNIQIADERANLVNDAVFSLDPGESNTLSFLVVPLMTEPLRNVTFKLTGVDPFGDAYTLETENAYEVYPFVDESQISVTLAAETVTQWTAETGMVTARVTIVNHSTVELTNVTVTETSIGVIKNYETLAAGETTFDQEIQLGSPRNLSFTVKGYDPTGTNRELASCLMPVAYGTSTAEVAAVTPQPDNGNMGLFNSLSNAITKVLIVLGALMVLSFVVLIVLTVMERSKTSMRMDDDDDDDDFEDYYEPRAERKPKQRTYTGAPDPEELSYTQRMLSARDEGQAGTVNNGAEPMRLPPPVREAPKPAAEEPRVQQRTNPVIYAEAPRSPKADEAAERLVTTARTRYTEEQAEAAYRPAGTAPKPPQPKPAPAVRPKAPEQAPRIFEYKKQPVRQPLTKRVVTRVEKQPGGFEDDSDE
ncbi:MAG TPA: hypothetical protein VN453_06155 [Feifaniaceae bacterium]|nr:hypothetical protein [Feifaniaceae bacterium]